MCALCFQLFDSTYTHNTYFVRPGWGSVSGQKKKVAVTVGTADEEDIERDNTCANKTARERKSDGRK